jgi:hypothetical protein
MACAEGTRVDSPIGQHAIDSTGSLVGVVRMDPNRSYVGVGELLRTHIDQSDSAAWEEIKRRLDYTYEALGLALAPLAADAGFSRESGTRVEGGQKLLFKPNLVLPRNIDPETRPGVGSTTCTEWPFWAALMRWCHHKRGISYYRMAVVEAATGMSAEAALCTILNREDASVTPEAVIEGKAGGFYGGWGFYFVRKYLSEVLDPARGDDPMAGYDESVTGTYLAPGRADDKLLVYDLNRICDNPDKGRVVDVADGDPNDPGDREAYPGCVLVNVPKLKVHSLTLFTNVIKNLGIGL